MMSMTPIASVTHEETTTGEHLRFAAIEQLMRSTGDDAAVLRLRELVLYPTSALEMLGRLAVATVPLPMGSPLLTLLAQQPLDPQWRQSCPPEPGSLWELRLFLDAILLPPPPADPYEELENLRAQMESGSLDVDPR